jgi:hypothetical protein
MAILNGEMFLNGLAEVLTGSDIDETGMAVSSSGCSGYDIKVKGGVLVVTLENGISYRVTAERIMDDSIMDHHCLHCQQKYRSCTC